MATQKIKWNEKLRSVRDKSYYTLDINIHKTITEQEKYENDFIENDSSLTENEKKFLLNDLQNMYDALRIGNNSVENQQCNNCLNWHQAIQYCEFCIRKYLENNFGNWTSGNNEIDKLIQECQRKIKKPNVVIEWIEYDQFENIEHLAEGGCATIYTAALKDGCYHKWNSERQILERFGRQKIVLKRLNNSNNNNVHWFKEVTLSFTLDNTSSFLSTCYGLTKDPTTQDYMLVLNYYDNDLRHFLKDNFHSLTLFQKYNIIYKIARNLNRIHSKNIVHRDLHSGNILYNSRNTIWRISDLGLSGPVDKPSNSIYGNLPYIAPEVICGEIYTTKSDIYSVGILMWEVITNETPFDDYEHDLELTLDIVKGCRPKIYEYIPHEYITLMKQCWDANSDNRPDAITVCKKMESLINVGILMWEVITNETPFDDYEHDLELTLDIVKGCRPKIYEYIPHEYITLMKQCWDANSDNRPDAITVCKKMESLIKSLYNEMDKQKENIENIQSKNSRSKIKNFFKLKSKKDKNNQVIINTQLSKNTKSKIYRIQNSKVYTFNIPIKPRNATDEEQQEFDSKQLEFEISEEIQQRYLKSVGADNSNKSRDDQEFGIAGPSN
ncbi:hypothetical protein Glove_362g56 [Diversispora epigaea]|uniref:Protein kinase domain-containing protein n=1 Tax=Diversispora epigaea TaxID=1348612 RepID=A0A397H9A5_9GLOM|nr:hypothetical protein Glove_362g56 [Diversispora epigaea]